MTAEEISSEGEPSKAMAKDDEEKVDDKEMSEEDDTVAQQNMEDSSDPVVPKVDTIAYETKDFTPEEESDEVEEAQHSGESGDTVVPEQEKVAELRAKEPTMVREDEVNNMPDLEEGFGQQLLTKIFGGRHKNDT